MLGSMMLEIAMGVIFVFILVSVACTALREVLEGFMKSRSAHLEHGIRELLHDAEDGSLTRDLYEHPLVRGLYAGEYRPPRASGAFSWAARGRNLPSYIPSRNFALALMDLAARGRTTGALAAGGAEELTAGTVRANLGRIGNPGVQRALLTALDEARGDLDRARANVEAWFDSSMDRVAGHYKRASQQIILVIGLALAVVLNVDALRIGDHLYRNDAARIALAAQVEGAVARGDTAAFRRDAGAALTTLGTLRLPVGWTGYRLTPEGWSGGRAERAWRATRTLASSLLGWLITGAAATLGAPFWFDLLNKVMVIRSTVKPREKSPEEGSEDRRPRRAGGGDATPARPAAPEGGAEDAGAAGEADEAAALAVAAPDEPDDVAGARIDPDTATPDDELPPARGGVA